MMNVNTCFVAMPTSVPKSDDSKYQDKNHFIHVYNHLFDPAIRELGYEPISPISKGSEIIQADIIRNLYAADLVLCDLSTLNANVFFEFGIRTALDRPVCLVADSATPEFPFDTAIINRHTYEAVLRIWNIEQQRSDLVGHMKDTVEKAKGRNSLWRHFGIETTGKLSPESYTESDKLDHLIEMLHNLTHARAKVPMRGFNLDLDALRVRGWAAQHNAQNPFDMGPRNFQRCLFDLGLEGGVEHELSFNDDGTLKHQ
jgi:hypothetical protein